MARRHALKARRRNAGSLEIGIERARAKLDALELQKREDAVRAAQEASREAVRSAVKGKAGGFVDGVKAKLFDMTPRRTGGGE